MTTTTALETCGNPQALNLPSLNTPSGYLPTVTARSAPRLHRAHTASNVKLYRHRHTPPTVHAQNTSRTEAHIQAPPIRAQARRAPSSSYGGKRRCFAGYPWPADGETLGQICVSKMLRMDTGKIDARFLILGFFWAVR